MERHDVGWKVLQESLATCPQIFAVLSDILHRDVVQERNCYYHILHLQADISLLVFKSRD